MRVLISDYQSDDRSFRLQLRHLPWAAKPVVSVRRWLLDGEHRFSVVEEMRASGNEITMERPFRSGSVCLVELRAVPVMPRLQPSRARESAAVVPAEP